MQMFPIHLFLLGNTWGNFLSSLPLLVCLFLLIPDDLAWKQTFKLMNLPFQQLLVLFKLQAFFNHLEAPHLMILLVTRCRHTAAEVIWNIIGGENHLRPKWWNVDVRILRLQGRGLQRILNLVIIKSRFFFKVLLIYGRLILNLSFYIPHKIQGYRLGLRWGKSLCSRLSWVISWI